jgi:hypothetical protein
MESICGDSPASESTPLGSLPLASDLTATRHDCSSAPRCPICEEEAPTALGINHRTAQGNCRFQTCLYLCLSSLATYLYMMCAHMPQDHTPRLGPRVTLLQVLIIIPHQLTIRFCHNRLLRVRVDRRSAVEMEPRVRHRCGEVRFVCNEKLSQKQ